MKEKWSNETIEWSNDGVVMLLTFVRPFQKSSTLAFQYSSIPTLQYSKVVI